MIKLLEQTAKMWNSEIMQKLIQESRAGLEELKKFGLTAEIELKKKIQAVAPEMKQLEKQIQAVAPQFFPITQEGIDKTKEKYSVRYKEPDLEEKIRNLKEKLQQAQKEAFAKDVCDFDFLWEVADEYNYRWNEGAYDTKKLAFQDAVNNATVKGQSIELATMEESIQRLHQELSKKKKRKPQDLKTYNPASEK